MKYSRADRRNQLEAKPPLDNNERYRLVVDAEAHAGGVCRVDVFEHIDRRDRVCDSAYEAAEHILRIAGLRDMTEVTLRDPQSYLAELLKARGLKVKRA